MKVSLASILLSVIVQFNAALDLDETTRVEGSQAIFRTCKNTKE